ncbi:MAG: hypothetical protein QM778_00890 [Myxococcales bacterium]
MACTLTVGKPTAPNMRIRSTDSFTVPITNSGDDRVDVVIKVYQTDPSTTSIPVARVGAKQGFTCFKGTFNYPVGWAGGTELRSVGLLARVSGTGCAFNPNQTPDQDPCAEANATFIVGG